MEYEVPEYRKEFGASHNSASGGTQTVDEHILKLYLRKEYKINFPFGAKPRAGQIVQTGADFYLGLDNYSPIQGQKKGIPIEEAIQKATTEFMTYQPRDWDDGRDMEDYQEIKNHIAVMIHNSVNGLKEYFGDVQIEGESQRWVEVDGIDVPTMLFLDYIGDGKQIDLKCSFPMRNPLKKDGTRSWRIPKPKTEPTRQQVLQQAVYWKATGFTPGLLFVTADGYNIVTADNCRALSEDSLNEAWNEIVHRWMIIQNLLKAANGNWKTLFGLVQPDFATISQRHGGEILNIAKNAWRI
jgi:hypothetical protein|tara:strand:- start:5539 stop:6429 length:891 start_codon:yes stop_codon:yes gene_type:complete